MKLLSFFVWATVNNLLMVSPHHSCPIPNVVVHFPKHESHHVISLLKTLPKGQEKSALQGSIWDLAPTYLCDVIWSQDSYSTLLPDTPPSHSSNNICLLWPTVGNNIASWPVYTLGTLCLCVMLRVGMHKTENRFQLRNQLIYSDDFYPIPFHFLKCWLQPAKLVSYS